MPKFGRRNGKSLSAASERERERARPKKCNFSPLKKEKKQTHYKFAVVVAISALN